MYDGFDIDVFNGLKTESEYLRNSIEVLQDLMGSRSEPEWFQDSNDAQKFTDQVRELKDQLRDIVERFSEIVYRF